MMASMGRESYELEILAAYRRVYIQTGTRGWDRGFRSRLHLSWVTIMRNVIELRTRSDTGVFPVHPKFRRCVGNEATKQPDPP